MFGLYVVVCVVRLVLGFVASTLQGKGADTPALGF
jgi:hypothetical protein